MTSRPKKLLAATLAGAGLSALCALSGPSSDIFMPSADAQEKKWKFYGAATCGGGSCHAASKMEDKRPANEYTTWTEKDRHAKAFETLYNDLSGEMMEALAEITGEDEGEASESKKCLFCHSTDAPKDRWGDKYNPEDGVSCDGCHGPAEGWFDPHTKPHKYEDMLPLGMFDTRDLWRRTDVCVYCHLQIEPNLVDAGHPDLSFELYQATMREPPHWYERQTWDGVRAWIVGQALSLRESLLKTKKRIDKGQAAESIEIAAAQAASYLTVFRHAIAIHGTDADKAFAKNMDALLNAEKLDNAALAKEAGSGAKLMDALGKRISKAGDGEFSKEKIKQLWDKITKDKLTLDGIDEFGAEQVAGAMYALYNSYKQGKGPRLKGEVETPDAIGKLLLRPAVLLPEDWWDDEGIFKSKDWVTAVGAASGLVK